ncbi:SGNH/GDSL hydrolase family protein [Geodermatophilus sp. SYSU D00867]
MPTARRSARAAVLAAVLVPTVCASSAAVAAPGNRPGDQPTGPVREVVSFGDSWSDAGTFGYVFGTTPGEAWPQLLAAEYGADQEVNRLVTQGEDGAVLSEETVGGLNYAEGGAFVAPITDDPDGTPRPMTAQLEAFLDEHGSFDSHQLVTVWAGGNDILTHLAGDEEQAARFVVGDLTGEEIEQATDEVVAVARREADLVADVLAAGAKRVAVLNMIDLGITAEGPGIQAGGNALAGALTTTFNLALADALPEDRRVRLVDVAGLFADVEASPAEYGFEVVDGDACTNAGFSCGPDAWVTPDADRTYAFAGYGHFTAATRELIAGFVHDEAAAAWHV